MKPGKAFIFDLDGTLTEPRRHISMEFALALYDFLMAENCYLVTGATYERITSQLPDFIIDEFRLIFPCLGNEIYEGNHCLSGPKTHEFDKQLIEDLKQFAHVDDYYEQRGMVMNFSPCGFIEEHRRIYKENVDPMKERKRIVKEISPKYPDYEFLIGGSVSIDIVPKGHGKTQILKNVSGDLVFFGDRTDKGGNDYELAKAIRAKNGRVHQVSNYIDTWDLINGY